MKCPFDSPVKAEYSEMSDAHIVIDPHDRIVAYNCNDKSSAYIAHVINSHEKLALYKDYVESRIDICTIPMCFNEWDKRVNDLADELQALEAEKSND